MYTPAFQKVLDTLQKMSEEGCSTEDAQQYFYSSVKKLGHNERIKNLYRIRDKFTGRILKFCPNIDQEKFLKEQTGRDLILKSRQIGFTTAACIQSYDHAIWDGWATGIMAHHQEKVKLIFEIVKSCNEFFKKDWGELYAPPEEANNTTRMSWDNPKGSVTVAYDFQGLTVARLHVSEAAFIEGARLTNSLQAVPDNGEIILESTPNGRGGFFYDCWQDWKRSGPAAPFKGHFYPWFNHYPEDPSKYKSGEGAKFTPEEELLREYYKLNDSHLIWRRYKIRESFQGSAEMFESQYPSDDVSCFLANDKGVFSKQIIAYQESFVQQPRFEGRLVLNGKRVEFSSEKSGIVKIFKLPETGSQYAIGADPSSGKGGDPGSICVLDYKTGEQVASIHGFLEPDLFADELFKIGQFYNQAFVCIETNNHGTAVILKMQLLRYPNFYTRQTFSNLDKKVSREIGFYTTSSNKLAITDHAVAMLREGKCILREKEIVDEMSTFANVQRKGLDGRVSSTMKREALPGCHDDRIMGLCFALEMIRAKPFNFENHVAESRINSRPYDFETGFLVTSNNYDFSL